MRRAGAVRTYGVWETFREFSPVWVRLLARQRLNGCHIRAITSQEVAIASGLPLVRVRAISRQKNWEGVSIPEAELFCRGCNFDPTKPADRNRFLTYSKSCQKNPNRQWFQYLQSSPQWETEFLPLVRLLRSPPTTSTATESPLSPERKSAA